MAKKLHINESVNEPVEIIGSRNYDGSHSFILHSPIFDDYGFINKLRQILPEYDITTTGHWDEAAVFAPKEDLRYVQQGINKFNGRYCQHGKYNQEVNEAVEIDVKNTGVLEVPEDKNVDELPIKHFVALANKKGLSTVTRALNNLQVWNKNKDPKLSKWAGDMIDKVTTRIENQKKNESFAIHKIKESADTNNLKDRMYEIGLDYEGVGRTGNLVFYNRNVNPTDVEHLYVIFKSWNEVLNYLNDKAGFSVRTENFNRDFIDNCIADMEIIGFTYDDTDNRGRLVFNSIDGNSSQAFPDWEEVRNYIDNGSFPYEFESVCVESSDTDLIDYRLECADYAIYHVVTNNTGIELISDNTNGKYELEYNGVTVEVEFNLEGTAKYEYTIDGEGPYVHSSYEYITNDIRDYINEMLDGEDL